MYNICTNIYDFIRVYVLMNVHEPCCLIHISCSKILVLNGRFTFQYYIKMVFISSLVSEMLPSCNNLYFVSWFGY